MAGLMSFETDDADVIEYLLIIFDHPCIWLWVQLKYIGKVKAERGWLKVTQSTYIKNATCKVQSKHSTFYFNENFM